jgi:hypothetical protein
MPEINTPAHDDSAILSLFREWVDVRRSAFEIDIDDEEKHDAAHDADSTLAHKIAGTPAAGIARLVVKAYLYFHFDDDELLEDLRRAFGRPRAGGSSDPPIKLRSFRNAGIN